MKQRSTTPVSKGLTTKIILVAAAVLMSIATPLAMVPTAKADPFDAQIAALQREIDAYNTRASELSKQAETYQRAVQVFENEIARIQKIIDLKQAEYEQLAAEITKNEQKIVDNKKALGDIIADLYVDDNISPLEMLASSSNIGDYVDKQALRSSVQDNLTQKIEEIKTLKKKLEQQKKDVERVLADQKNARADQDSKRAEQQSLFNQTKGEENSFRLLSEAQKAKKLELQRQQQAAIEAAIRRAGGGSSAVAGDPNKGGYPAVWANSDYYNPPVDDWGMYARQCVSYTAWKVFQKNGSMPYWGGRGNANQWPGNARAAGIPTGSTPRVGSVGVITAGQYGHVVWVEGINGDGTINISQYNYYNAGGSGWGNYSEMYSVSPAAYDVYIYF